MILLSTSGNSKNQIIAAKKCQELGVKVVSFTGKDGGELKKLSDLKKTDAKKLEDQTTKNFNTLFSNES